MTVKLVVLYTMPEDPEAFDLRYRDVHGPLVEQMPGLLRWDTSRVVAAPDGGDLTYYRIVNLYFADDASLGASVSSEAGQATADDFQKFAPPGTRMFVAAIDD
jgi:uncharacterized protein (TIGR02118 family)